MNRPRVITNQTDRIGEHFGHLKDLEISKYKQESKGLMAIQFIVLFLLIVGFLNIKSVKHIMKTLLQMEMYYVQERVLRYFILFISILIKFLSLSLLYILLSICQCEVRTHTGQFSSR